MNKWWEGRPEQKYWLEATDRDDLGANLHAPQFNDQGKEYWSYALVRETCMEDVVLHYSKNERPPAIVAYSVVSSGVREEDIVGAARGRRHETRMSVPTEDPVFW